MSHAIVTQINKWISKALDEKVFPALFLINPGNTARDVMVRLGDFKDQSGKSVASVESELYVAGAVWTRRWGQTLRAKYSA